MKASRSISSFLAKAQERDSYWVEHAKLEVSLAMERERRKSGLSYKSLAEKLGTSPAYISKVFRGDANLTIETMVKLARTLGCQLELDLKERVQETQALHVWSAVPKTPITENSLRTAFAAYMDENDGIKVGRFSFPDTLVISCNDQAYLDAA